MAFKLNLTKLMSVPSEADLRWLGAVGPVVIWLAALIIF
jgi:hypothetical protein